MSVRGIPGFGVFSADLLDGAGSPDVRKNKYKKATRTYLDSFADIQSGVDSDEERHWTLHGSAAH